MGVACSTNGEKKNAYRLLVGNALRKRPLEKPRWGCGLRVWLRIRTRALGNTVMNLRVP
jgi:hypothetical protein